MTWQDAADEALAHNVADVMANGPGLRWSRKTAAIAIDRRNRYVCETGYGAMGVGTMWHRYDEEQPEWADLPEQDATGDLGGPRHDGTLGDELVAWLRTQLDEDDQAS